MGRGERGREGTEGEEKGHEDCKWDPGPKLAQLSARLAYAMRGSIGWVDIYVCSTKPSAQPPYQDTAHPVAPVGTPGSIAKWPGAERERGSVAPRRRTAQKSQVGSSTYALQKRVVRGETGREGTEGEEKGHEDCK